MRILLASHHFPPNFLSGAEWQAYRIAYWLKEAGHNVQVLCVESDTYGQAGQLKYQDEVYNDIPVRRLFFNLPAASDPFRWSFRNPLIKQHAKDILLYFQPDVLHLISGYLLSGSIISAARSLDVPTVLMPMDFWFLCPRITLLHPDGSLCGVPKSRVKCVLCLRQDKRRYRWANKITAGRASQLMRLLWKLPLMLKRTSAQDVLAALQERDGYLKQMFGTANVVISNSQFLRRMLDAHGFRSIRFVQLRQGLDTERWDSPEKTSSSPLHIGYIGQIAKHKGVDMLVRAFKRLRANGNEVRLSLYGDFTRAPGFVRKVRHLIGNDRRIKFAGTFAHDQISQVYRELDILVVPSIWHENSPNVILEALAFKVPVVASAIGGIPEMVSHEVNGLLFEPGSPSDLAKQLRRLLDEPSLLSRLCNNIKPVKTIEEEMTELMQVYESLVTEHEME